jgi:hypothetical protein
MSQRSSDSANYYTPLSSSPTSSSINEDDYQETVKGRNPRRENIRFSMFSTQKGESPGRKTIQTLEDNWKPRKHESDVYRTSANRAIMGRTLLRNDRTPKMLSTNYDREEYKDRVETAQKRIRSQSGIDVDKELKELSSDQNAGRIRKSRKSKKSRKSRKSKKSRKSMRRR